MAGKYCPTISSTIVFKGGFVNCTVFIEIDRSSIAQSFVVDESAIGHFPHTENVESPSFIFFSSIICEIAAVYFYIIININRTSTELPDVIVEIGMFEGSVSPQFNCSTGSCFIACEIAAIHFKITVDI